MDADPLGQRLDAGVDLLLKPYPDRIRQVPDRAQANSAGASFAIILTTPRYADPAGRPEGGEQRRAAAADRALQLQPANVIGVREPRDLSSVVKRPADIGLE